MNRAMSVPIALLLCWWFGLDSLVQCKCKNRKAAKYKYRRFSFTEFLAWKIHTSRQLHFCFCISGIQFLGSRKELRRVYDLHRGKNSRKFIFKLQNLWYCHSCSMLTSLSKMSLSNFQMDYTKLQKGHIILTLGLILNKFTMFGFLPIHICIVKTSSSGFSILNKLKN